MKTIYIFLADGFELLETFSPVDVLSRCGANVITVSINDDLKVKSSQGTVVFADKLLKDIDVNEGEGLVIPGGNPGYINLRKNKDVVEIVKNYLYNNKLVAAICGAPTIFPKNNFGQKYKLTAHSGTRKDFTDDYNYSGENLVEDRNLITAIGAAHSLDFAFKIAEKFFDTETINKVKIGMECK